MTLIRDVPLCFALLGAVMPAWADRAAEDEQDRMYVQCLAERQINPSDITPEVSTLCKRKAGIEDPGDIARKTSSEAWRNCLLDRSVEFDDGVSPVTEIARAIIQLCAKEWDGYVASLWMPQASKRQMSHGLLKYGTDEGVRAVLLHRRVRKERQGQSR